MFELNTGALPFEGDTETKLFNNIVNHRVAWPKDIPDSARDLLSRMLVQNPAQRINIDKICQHRWVINASVSPVKSCFSASTSPSSTRNTSFIGLKNLNEQNRATKEKLKLAELASRLQTKCEDTMRQSFE